LQGERSNFARMLTPEFLTNMCVIAVCQQGNHGIRNRKLLSDEQDKALPEDRKSGQKRLREEGCGSSSAAADVKGVGTSGDVIEKPPSTNMEHVSELDKLKML
jgi:hypothetical protein